MYNPNEWFKKNSYPHLEEYYGFIFEKLEILEIYVSSF
jgi:hypothetical protein